MPGPLDIRRAEIKARKEQDKRNAEAEKAADQARTEAEQRAEAEIERAKALDEMHTESTQSTRPDLEDDYFTGGARGTKKGANPPENKSATSGKSK